MRPADADNSDAVAAFRYNCRPELSPDSSDNRRSGLQCEGQRNLHTVGIESECLRLDEINPTVRIGFRPRGLFGVELELHTIQLVYSGECVKYYTIRV